MFLLYGVSTVFAQTVAISPTPEPQKKANVRAEDKPSNQAEPFDKATTSEMAAKCIRFDTDAGEIDAELFPESAPETVRNFLNLISIGAFDMTLFSRVVPGFVIQGGNVRTKADGATPEIAARARRPIPDEPNRILHERGILSMARSDEPNSATSNFFILVSNGSHLDGTFAAFGRVTKGIEVVDAINKAQVTNEKPEKPVRINKINIYSCTATKLPTQ